MHFWAGKEDGKSHLCCIMMILVIWLQIFCHHGGGECFHVFYSFVICVLDQLVQSCIELNTFKTVETNGVKVPVTHQQGDRESPWGTALTWTLWSGGTPGWGGAGWPVCTGEAGELLAETWPGLWEHTILVQDAIWTFCNGGEFTKKKYYCRKFSQLLRSPMEGLEMFKNRGKYFWWSF